MNRISINTVPERLQVTRGGDDHSGTTGSGSLQQQCPF